MKNWFRNLFRTTTLVAATKVEDCACKGGWPSDESVPVLFVDSEYWPKSAVSPHQPPPDNRS